MSRFFMVQCVLSAIRKSHTGFPMSLRWVAYVAP